MRNALFVPMPLDALFLDRAQTVVETMANFNRLPYFNGFGDVNPDFPNISEEFVSQPFLDHGLYLQPGVHLHWALPEAFILGSDSQDAAEESQFPAVPNRWLITRSRAGQIERQWVVESDYLFQAGEPDARQSISFPFHYDPQQRCSFLGRKYALEDWLHDPASPAAITRSAAEANRYLPAGSLTAFGYGEPAFSAFYPNSYSVFGLHDPEIRAAAQLKDLTYDVIGWYSDLAQDPLAALQQDPPAGDPWEAIREKFGWQIGAPQPGGEAEEAAGGAPVEGSPAAAPERTVCYAGLTFRAPKGRRRSPMRVAVGNSSREALSALLAQEIAQHSAPAAGPAQDATRRQVEELLEAIQLDTGSDSSGPQHGLLSGPELDTARHELGFGSLSGGQMWILRLESAQQAQADVHLPGSGSLADLLDRLNVRQQAYEQAHFTLESLRVQLFADWYKYMLSAYPPPGAYDQYPNIDEARHFLQIGAMQALAEWNPAPDSRHDVLELEPDRCGQPLARIYGEGRIADLARQVAEAIADLLESPELNAYQLVQPAEIQDWPGVLKPLVILFNTPVLKQMQADAELTPEQKALLLYLINTQIMDRNFYQQFPRTGDEPDALQALRGLPADAPQHLWLRLNRLLMEAACQGKLAHRPNLVLQQIPAPRFWQPNEPVVLVAGPAAKPSQRHGANARDPDSLLTCHLVELAGRTAADQLAALRAALDPLAQNPQAGGFHRWAGQPWNPILLEWLAELIPVKSGSNLDAPNHATFRPDFITANYHLPENQPDLAARKPRLERAANVYSGRSILTPHASLALKERIEDFFERRLAGMTAESAPLLQDWLAQQPSQSLSPERIAAYQKWYETRPVDETQIFSALAEEERIKDPLYLALYAYRWLKVTPVLAQSLGGFNQALLMQRLTLQLSVADPIGFAGDREFSQAVQKLVHESVRVAPQPLNDFNPIRSGALRLLKLRLVDTFGQFLNLELEEKRKDEQGQKVIASSALPPLGGYRISLPPRLTQPARLNFRWLSALSGAQDGAEMEMNADPASSPVCGWLLPSQFDCSLQVFDGQGQALGIINMRGGWEEAPRAPAINPHLARVVAQLRQLDLPDFVRVLEAALDEIGPPGPLQREDLTMLIGRPVAVVRASLSLEVQGRPAVNQGWRSFERDMRRALVAPAPGLPALAREDDGFPAVQFPIRLGQLRQRSDGLIGFWVENNGGPLRINDTPRAAPAQPGLSFGAGQPLMLSIQAEPLLLTMLVDPRCKVQAECGVLPAKAISIPPEQFGQAFQRIEVSILSAPLLTPRGSLQLPLPQEAGRQWSWLARKDGAWSGEIALDPFNPQTAAIGPVEIREGWLKRNPSPERKNAAG